MVPLVIPEVDTSAVEDALDKFSDAIDAYSNLSLSEAASRSGSFLLYDFLPKLGKTVLIFLIGYILIRLLMRVTQRFLKVSKINPSLHSFISSSTKIVLTVVLCITCMELLGIKLTSLITLLGILGLAISLAVKDTLSNVAGGVTVLFSPPFTKGDFVEINGQPGTVWEMGLVYTQLLTVDNKKIYLPNGDVAKAIVVNYSAEPVRRLDLTFPVKAVSNYQEVRNMMLSEIAKAPLALKDPAPNIRITDQSFSYVKMTVMVWVNTPDLVELSSYLTDKIRGNIAQNNW